MRGEGEGTTTTFRYFCPLILWNTALPLAVAGLGSVIRVRVECNYSNKRCT